MKGLIRNNFYSMESNVKISFIIALFLSVVAFFVQHSAFIQMIIAMQVFIFIVNVGTSLHADVVSKWNRFELTLPVKHNDIIKAKYISFAMLFLLGVVMGSITAISVCVTSGLSNMPSVLYGYEFGLLICTRYMKQKQSSCDYMIPAVLKIS